MEKTMTPKEKREARREFALMNLDSSLWNYATPKLVTPEQYGQLSLLAKEDYNQTISKSPEQSLYEQLFLPQLASEGGAVTSPYLQERSLRILQESILDLKVEDIANYLGLKKPIKKDYKDKYISELNEEDSKVVIGSYMSVKANDIIAKLLGRNKQKISGGLEEILCESEKGKEIKWRKAA